MRCWKNRQKLFFYAVLLAAYLVACCTHRAQAQQQAHPIPADMLAGETLSYSMDFWLFRNAAAGQLCFSKTDQGYSAVFEAETSGLLRLISGYRKEIMESVMEYDAARQRLRPRLFRETFIQGKKAFKKTLSFNYEKNMFSLTREYPGARPVTMRSRLPDLQFEDLLSFFYNYRLGWYGMQRQADTLRVMALMKENPSYITVDFPAQGSRECASGFNATLSMERDLTQARSKKVLVRLSETSIPEKALIVDAYFFGDLAVNLAGSGIY